jgi:hypothetical protein
MAMMQDTGRDLGVNPIARVAAGSQMLRPSKSTGCLRSDLIRVKFGRRKW